MKYRYSTLIPCYNVGSACVPVLQCASRYSTLCIAVDDGSSDDTLQHIESSGVANLQILRHENNCGKGQALLTGFRYFLDQTDCDAVITLDGDGQHDPEFIPQFQEKYEKQQWDLVYGNRMFHREKIPLHRRWLNLVSNRIISRICSHPVYDSQCGFRLYSRKLLDLLLPRLRSGRYELETEILLQTYRQNFPVTSVPISTIYSAQSTSLSHHGFSDVIRIARLMARFWFFQR